MAYSSFVGSFNIDTSKTVGQTQAITGLGFQPKIVMFWWSGSVATGDAVSGGNVNIGIGAATSDSNRYAALAFMEDAQATADTYRSLRNDCCILGYTDAASGGLDGVADFASLDADGFTLTIDDQFSLALRISYLALGGTDLTNVYVGDGVMPTSAGNYNETGVGFQPDALLIVSNFRTVFTTSTGSNLSLGMATGSSNQGVVSIFSFDNIVTSDTTAYGYNGEIDATATTGAVSVREAFVVFGADGFTLNHLEGSIAVRYFYICLKGGQYSVGDLLTRTDGNDIAETVGFQPVALLFASANRALSTQDTHTDHARLSIGAATSATNRAVQAISDEDNLADSETAFANYDTAVYAQVVDDAIVGLMDIKSIDASGFTVIMDDTDPSACWVTYLAIGAAAAAGRTAALDQTQAADTPASTATLSLSGAAAPTQAADGLTALATLSITAALEQAQAADVLTAEGAGAVQINGALDVSQAADTIAATGALAIAGALDQTQVADVPASTATLKIAGALEQAQAADSIISSGTLAIAGLVVQSQAADVLTATGTSSPLGAVVVTQAADTLTSTGALKLAALVDMTAGADTSTITGTLAIAGTVTVTQADAVMSAAGLVLDMAYARPTTDTYAGEWTNQDGGTTNLYDSINEETAADADYVQSPLSPSASAVTFALGALSTPGQAVAHVLSYRYGKAPGDTTETVSLTVQLRQGYTNESSMGTLIKEWEHINISTTLATVEQSLTTAEIENISNYSALFVRMVAEAA